MGQRYSSQSASGYNSSPPPDDGTTVAANKITWAGIKSKLSDVLKTFAEAINSQLVTALDFSATTTSISYTTLVGDHQKPIECSGTITISLGDAATMAAGYQVTVHNKGTGVVTLGVITATDTMNGSANGTVKLLPGESVLAAVNQAANGYRVISDSNRAAIRLTGAAGTNTITAACDSLITGLSSGQLFVLVPANTNTSATTLNITPSGGSALTAKNVFANGVACSGAELKAGVPSLLEWDGTQFNVIGASKQPTRTVLTSGSGTYTTPSGATRIDVQCIGGGGSGLGSGPSPGTANAGGNTTFSTLTANGGASGTTGTGGVSGGSASGGDINITGGNGGGSDASVTNNTRSGAGGNSVFGGGGPGTQGTTGISGVANTGGGGAGGGGNSNANVQGVGGGGAGGYCRKLITSPAATYSYAVGAGGSAGAAGTGGTVAGSGGSGIIIVDEYYN